MLMLFLFTIFLAHINPTCSDIIRDIQGLPFKVYQQIGDINLGAVVPIHKYAKDSLCGTELRELGALQRVEAIAYSINEINKDPSILPNYTLGFTIIDDCSKDATALARALHFVQSPLNDSSVPTLPMINAVGVIGSESSKNTVEIASVLSLYKLPLLSYISTSPLLSDNYQYPYFSRIVAPDTFQAKALVSVAKHFGWTYMSVVYTEGSYGAEGYKALKQALENENFCLAESISIKQSYTTADYNDVITKLLRTEQAKAVVIFSGLAEAKKVMQAAQGKRVAGKFTWLGSEAWGRNRQDYDGIEEVAAGALTIKLASNTIPEFDTYFKALSPIASNNPWLVEYCNYTNCLGENYNNETTVSLVRDSVYAFAYALNASCYSDNLEVCTDGGTLLGHLRNVSFRGKGGVDVSFQSDGSGEAVYFIQNFYKVDNNTFTIDTVGTWAQGQLTLFKNTTWNPKSIEDPPVSVCSLDCLVGEQQVRTQPDCCWYCDLCNDNERTVHDNVSGLLKCKSCPGEIEFTWPDTTTRSECIQIPVTFLKLYQVEGALTVALSVLVLVLTVLVFISFWRNREEKLIKASSRELSNFMLFAIVVSSVLSSVNVIEPSDTMCILRYFGFHISFTSVYAPLAVKANRIYRIFSSGKKSKRKPPFIEPRSQIIFTLLIAFAQVFILGLALGLDQTSAEHSMPNMNEKVVELTCSRSYIAFGIPLAFNLVLVVICTGYGLLTRKLPANFNESRYITFCVYTTIVMWLAFLPTYFTTNSSKYQTLFLCVAMIANNLVFLIFLFLPKLYALHFVSVDKQNVSGTTSDKRSTEMNTSSVTKNVVAPSTPNNTLVNRF